MTAWRMATVLSVLLIFGCGGGKKIVTDPITADANVFLTYWIMLEEPVSGGYSLGMAYDFEGTPNLGCYSVGGTTSADSVKSWDAVIVKWNRTSDDTVKLGLLKLFKLGYVGAKADSGSLTFHGIKTTKAVDMAPIPGSCLAVDSFGLPTKPGITALIGADSARIVFFVEEGREAVLDSIQKVPGIGVSVDRSSGNSGTLKFDSFRWFGVQLTGYGVDSLSSVRDTARSFPMDVPVKMSEDKLTFTVRALTDGRYEVTSVFRDVGAVPRVDIVGGNGEHFQVGTPNNAQNFYWLGELYVGASRTYVHMLILEQRKRSEVSFDSHAEKAAIAPWVNAKKGNQPDE